MGLFKESTIDAPTEDLFWEHSQHFEKIPEKCSGCFSEQQGLRGVTLNNEVAENNLSILKAKIEEKRKKREEEKLKLIELADEIKSTLLQVPEVIEGSLGEFKAERYTQLCKKVDVLYHNYLVSTEQLLENPIDEEKNKIFQETIKELSSVYEDLLLEGVKIRW
jgi:hypothetical protein